MIPAAPPVPPEAHIAERGPRFRSARSSVIKGGLLAFVATAIAAQIVPLSIEVFGGGLALSTAPPGIAGSAKGTPWNPFGCSP